LTVAPPQAVKNRKIDIVADRYTIREAFEVRLSTSEDL